MFNKKPIIKYESALEFYSNPLTPAKNHIPEWYKKIPKWKNNKIFSIETGFNETVKQCMPFLDSLTTGYMITLPHDINVTNDNGVPLLNWKHSEYPPKSRNEVSNSNLVPFGHFPMEFIWNFSCAIMIPKGYSILITHPINRHDLPFTTLSGIIDGEMILHTKGNVPFYIKQNFEGIISQGTPIAQLIPFRQENWISKKQLGLVKKGEIYNFKSASLIFGWYKKTFWTHKKYF